MINHAGVPVERLTPDDGHYFFGYYDKCPWNRTQDKVIACRTTVAGRLPGVDDHLTIGYVEADGRQHFTPLMDTTAWNFQQGAMAQWLDLGGVETILFNVRHGASTVARVMSVEGRLEREYEQAIYAVSPDGRWGAAVDFGRLARVRPGYGYADVDTPESAEVAPSRDGLILVDMKSGTRQLWTSYAQLASSIHPRGEGSPHWIDHIEFSPDSRFIVFLHRWLAKDGAPLTRMMAIDRNDGNLTCILDCGAAGHGCWLDGERYGIWGRQGTVASVARATTSWRTAPLRWSIKAGRMILPPSVKRRFHRESLMEVNVQDAAQRGLLAQIPFRHRGGHPSMHPQKSLVVCDTIPDRKGWRTLFLASLDGARFLVLADFEHDRGTVNASFRCDLHPRWNREGAAICIDSLHEGFRGMYRIDVSSALTGWP